jgi:hypothetical protein
MNKPRTTPQDAPGQPFVPSTEDRAAAAEMSERGAFKPPATRPTDVRKTGRWGRALKTYADSLKRQK